MASEDFNKLQNQVDRLTAEFNLFKQEVNKNIYSKLVVFVKDVLFRRTAKILRNGVQYNVAPDYVELVGTSGTTVSSTSTWENWDLSATIPVNAIRVDILLTNVQDAAYVAGIRENGSALSRVINVSNDSQFVLTTNLDSDRIIERYTTNTNVSFFILGYYI